MNATKIKARIATLEHMYSCMTSAASLSEKAAVVAKIRALKNLIGE